MAMEASHEPSESSIYNSCVVDALAHKGDGEKTPTSRLYMYEYKCSTYTCKKIMKAHVHIRTNAMGEVSNEEKEEGRD